MNSSGSYFRTFADADDESPRSADWTDMSQGSLAHDLGLLHPTSVGSGRDGTRDGPGCGRTEWTEVAAEVVRGPRRGRDGPLLQEGLSEVGQAVVPHLPARLPPVVVHGV